MPNQLPPGQAQTVRGPIEAVPCPHCGRPNDYRTMSEQQLLDTGHRMFCDHCGYSMEVCRISQVTVVTVRKDPKGGRAQPRGVPGRQVAGQQQPRQQGGIMGGIRKLLGAPGTKR